MWMIRKGLCAFLWPDGFCLFRREACDLEHDYAPCKYAVRRFISHATVNKARIQDVDLSIASNRSRRNVQNAKSGVVHWSCKRKGRYKSERDAQRAARRMSMRYDVTMRHYYCKFCNGYHLTKKSYKEEGEK